jgi:hypothetical protein
MELFAPGNLPGTGMGDIASIGGICGLIGLAVTSGALLVEGVLGTILYLLCALAVLGLKNDPFGESAPMVGIALVAIVAVSMLRFIIGSRRGLLAFIAATLGGGAVGYAWAEWNEVPFGFDSESAVAIAVGCVAAAIGARAAQLFLEGSIRAGGHAGIVGFVVCTVALALNALSFYVPFAGAAVLVLALIVMVRLGRRDKGKYEGLRILS